MDARITFEEARKIARAKVVEMAEVEAHALKEVVDFVTNWLLTEGIKTSFSVGPDDCVVLTMEDIGRVAVKFWANDTTRPHVSVVIYVTGVGAPSQERVSMGVAQRLREAGFKDIVFLSCLGNRMRIML
jgi:hypothetical protein